MNQPRPNSRYDHVYAVARFDTYVDPLTEPHMAFTVTKVVWTEEFADAEVRRLNALNNDKGAVYFVILTRLERGNNELEPSSEVGNTEWANDDGTGS